MLNRANRFDGGYQPLKDRKEENQPREEVEQNELESEGKRQKTVGDNFPIVELKAYNADGKEAHFIQINQIIDKKTGDKTAAEEVKKSRIQLHA